MLLKPSTISLKAEEDKQYAAAVGAQLKML